MGRYGLAFFALGALQWAAGCPLWSGPMFSALFSALGAIFCTWGALWIFCDTWDQAGTVVHPSDEPRSEHTPPGECP
jgi:hypothetical protein